MENTVFQYHQDLNGLEVLKAQYKQQNFARHSHEGYTIGLIENGAQRFFRSGANHVAPASCIILVNADQVHNGQTATEHGWGYRAMYPTPELFEGLTDDIGKAKLGAPYFEQAVVFDPVLAQQMAFTFDLLATEKSVLAKQSALYQLLINLIARHNKSAFNLKGLSRKPQLNTALDYLRDYYFDNISLTELAAIAHMSPFHFIRQFKAETGMTPHVYQTQFRINRAKQMLRSGLAINEVALSVGFYDQSHFHRYFKKNMGLTPKQYSKAVLYQAS